MRFSNPVAVTCVTCGRPTVMAETAIGAVRVHCGTWRWQCDTSTTSIEHGEGHAVLPIGRSAFDAAPDQELAA
jgi:hypothetical protein